MQFSYEWLSAQVKNYCNNQHKNPVFISDWNINNSITQIPFDLVNTAFFNSNNEAHLYKNIDDHLEVKKNYSSLLANIYKLSISPMDITVTTTSTNSLYLTLHALFSKGIKKYLVLTPVYFSVKDTLKDLNCTTVYYPLIDKNNFCVEIDKVIKTVKANNLEAIIITDPVHGAGVELPIETYKELSSFCNNNNIWLICDYTLGGSYWDEKIFSVINTNKFQQIIRTNKFIIIDSLAKKLFLNGVKNSTIFAPEDIIKVIEDLVYQVSGGLCFLQLSLFNELINPINQMTLKKIMQANIDKTISNYQLLKTALLDTNYSTYEPTSGHFGMIYHNTLLAEEIDEREIFKLFLNQYGVYILPCKYFSYSSKNQFSFRINFLGNFNEYLSPLIYCIYENLDLLKMI
jgi:aspartate/methionine/tyrosine aminotransferase